MQLLPPLNIYTPLNVPRSSRPKTHPSCHLNQTPRFANQSPANDWDPQQYLKFKDERLRPALDLLAQLRTLSPNRVVDLGCGTGHITQLLKQQWPQASVTGVDNSPTMLEEARQHPLPIDWQQQSIANWRPQQPVDLIFSNAALHWLPHHKTLLPHLMRQLSKGGVLAVQIPTNQQAPSHRIITELSKDPRWSNRLQPIASRLKTVLPAARYYPILAPLSQSVQLWETTYTHILSGDNPVAQWTKGAILKPYLDALPEPLKTQFETEYQRRIRRAYPPQKDGHTLFPVKRLFIMATR